MTTEFDIGDEVWYGAYPDGARHTGKVRQIIVDKDGIKYLITKSNEKHKHIFRTEKELCIDSLKRDISTHLDYVEWLKKQIEKWEKDK